MMRSQGTLFSLTFVAATSWLVANLNVALNAIGNIRPVFTTREGIQVTLPGGQQLRTLARGAGPVRRGAHRPVRLRPVAGMADVAVRRAVRRADPILGHDVSFYVFSLPFLRLIHRLSQTMVVLAALTSGAIYLVSGHLTSGFPARLSMSPVARRHLVLLAAAFFLLLAWGAWLTRAGYLVEPSGMIFGASYADVLRPHAGVAVADGGRCRRGCSGGVARVRREELADSPRDRALYRRVDRR